MKNLTSVIIIFFSTHFLAVGSAGAKNKPKLTIEAGYVWQDRNDFRISPQSGTLAKIDDFDRGPFVHYRVEYSQNISDKHGIRLVYAPFEVNLTGVQSSDVNFNGLVFSGSQPIDYRYKFNSYRIGYTYDYYSDSSSKLQFGFTGKIRDAVIGLTQGVTTSSYENIGFVPLFFASYQNNFTPDWGFYSDVDVSAAPQGRAIDLTVKLRRDLSQSSSLGFGYRTIEGGADNDKVFSFSWFNYAIFDYVIKF